MTNNIDIKLKRRLRTRTRQAAAMAVVDRLLFEEIRHDRAAVISSHSLMDEMAPQLLRDMHKLETSRSMGGQVPKIRFYRDYRRSFPLSLFPTPREHVEAIMGCATAFAVIAATAPFAMLGSYQ